MQAPIFFKVPLMRHLLFLCGAGTPATKKGMMALFERRSDFGILPGGSEEVRRRCVCVCVCVCARVLVHLVPNPCLLACT